MTGSLTEDNNTWSSAPSGSASRRACGCSAPRAAWRGWFAFAMLGVSLVASTTRGAEEYRRPREVVATDAEARQWAVNFWAHLSPLDRHCVRLAFARQPDQALDATAAA